MGKATSLIVLALSGCGRSPEASAPAPAAARLPNVVLVTLDTTRADRIGAYGYEHAKTPVIDALAAAGRRYDRAYSPLPLTIPSHATLFTGKYPPRLGIRQNGDGNLRAEELTLGEILKDAGYATAASVAAFVTTRAWGFDQGFDAYFDEISPSEGNFWHAERAGEEVVADILGWQASQPEGQPKFVWVHLFDAHFPYAPPEPYRSMQQDRPYDGEISYVDAQVGKLVEAFAGEPTIFVLAGDHGESLGDHGELTHGLFAYDATQRVPLVVSGEGIDPGVVSTPVSLADVLPTLLATLGLEAPDGIDGVAVASDRPHPVYMETYQLRERFGLSPHVAVVDGRFKYVATPRPELYDLLADPGEEQNLADDNAEEVARLAATLEGFGFAAPSGDEKLTDPSIAAQLEALGYVEGGFSGDVSGPLPDPKDHKRLVMLSQRAERRMQERNLEEAVEVLAELAENYPDVVEFQNRQATALARLQRLDEALVVIEAALARHPDSVPLRHTRAGHLARLGRFREAADLYREVALEMPYSPRIRAMALAALLAVEGAREEALALGASYLEQYPDDYAVAGIMGVETFRTGNPVAALPLLKKGMLADRPERDVAFTLATMAKAAGDLEASAHYIDEELRHWPVNRAARVAKVSVLARAEDWQGEIALLEELLTADGSDPTLWHAKAQALFNLGRYTESREALQEGLKRDPDLAILLLLDANLLSKEGKPEEAKAKFEQAQAAKEKEERALREAVEARRKKGGQPG